MANMWWGHDVMDEKTDALSNWQADPAASETTEHDHGPLVRKILEDLRKKLLDTTTRNALLNFRFSARSRSHVRVVDVLPDLLYARLVDSGESLAFDGLPDPDDVPKDEQNPAFLRALENAILTDEEYRKGVEALGSEGADGDASQRLERELRDRVRSSLGLPSRARGAQIDLAEFARDQGWNPEFDLPRAPEDGCVYPSRQDNRIRTLLFPQQMQRKLSGIREGARLSLEERGLNTLFLAFGFLEWYESNASDKVHFAPLVLHPVDLQQKLVGRRYRYSIASLGEETEVNLTLREYLRNDFGIELPELEEADTPEGYFHKVCTAIADQKRWKVRRFVTLGLFTFSRLVMYKDLDPQRWPEKQPLEGHPVLSRLLGGSDHAGPVVAEEYDVDHPSVEPKVRLLISKADASQLSAIFDALEGRNMAIQGPPGTGKSQSISNLIAAALSGGKKVLFVAEKMAALDVVKKRLDQAGVGDFCLELHSTKIKKTAVLESLERRLNRSTAQQPRDFEETLREHRSHREALSRYAAKLNTVIGDTGQTLHEILWGATRSLDRAARLDLSLEVDPRDLEGVLTWPRPKVGTKRSVLRTFEEHVRAVLNRWGDLSTHPWAFLGTDVRSPFDVEEIEAGLRNWRERLVDLHETILSCEEAFGVDLRSSVSTAKGLVTALSTLPDLPENIEAGLLPVLRAPSPILSVARFLGDHTERSAALDRVRSALAGPGEHLPPEGALLYIYRDLRGLAVSGLGSASVVGGVSDVLAKVRSHADGMEHLRVIARRIAPVLGMAPPVSTKKLGLFAKAAAIYRKTPRDVLEARYPSLFRPTSRGLVSELEAQARGLKETRDGLRQRFTFSYEEDPSDYRAHVNTLRVTGPWGRIVSREFRQAQTVWKLLQRTPRRATPFEMAAELEEVADHIERYREYQASDFANEVCGGSFRGVDTPFSLLGRVIDFASEVLETIRGGDEISVKLRQVLLEGDLHQMEDVLGCLTEDEVEAVGNLVRDIEIPDPVLVEDDLEDALSQLRVDVEKIQEIWERIQSLEINPNVQVEDLPALEEEVRRLRKASAAVGASEVGRGILAGYNVSTRGARERIHRTIEFAQEVLNTNPPEFVRDWVLADEVEKRLREASSLRSRLDEALRAEAVTRENLVGQRTLDLLPLLGDESGSDVLLDTASDRVKGLLADRDCRGEWLDLCRLRRDVEEEDLGAFLADVWHDRERLRSVGAYFDVLYYRSVLKAVFKEDPELERFSGMRQAETRSRFQALDREIISLQREKLAAKLARVPAPAGVGAGPKSEWTELALIRNEIGKKKRHIPIRKLVERAGNAILAVKPCWMMSPSSVAQFVRPGLQLFDLVVMDEASQMKPEEAIGATARGKQLVVVGDPKQLPPTTFFERTEMGEEDSEDSEDYVENESILDLALARFRPHRELKWHYRSRHESLIAFSNDQFYDNALVLFPSPESVHPEYGVEHRFVENGRYSKGGTNVPELETVANAAVEFMRAYPRKSLGIVTMNLKQAQLLQEEMDRVLQEDATAEKYRIEWEGTLEPFFVKTLEHVQGDERDVMFISTVYGPNEDGRVLQRFGPINSRDGHRRLNVLFTRAKEKVVLFTSMRSSDVHFSSASHGGVRVLRRYLEYAETGRLDTGTATGRPPESDFEEAVAERLRHHGFEVEAQVGVAGYRIDIGVRSPMNPSRYLLGVECDGATYHSAKSARDRDRLREEVLRDQGWTLYRVWSTDWFRDRQRETEKLIRFVQRCAEDEAKSESA